MDLSITFKHIACLSMSEEDMQKCSQLFSSHYGTWGDDPACPERKGKNIKMSPDLFRRRFLKPNRYIIMAFDNTKLIGHVVYLKTSVPRKYKKNTISWILQIVVDKGYRGKEIGIRMMTAIWGMSDYAWGLYTAHPLTIATLEKATLRRVIPTQLTNERLEELKLVAADLFENMEWIQHYHDGKVKTEFYISHEKIAEQIKKSYRSRVFPFSPLDPGEEWLAFVFDKQPLIEDAYKHIRKRIQFDMERLKRAYANMKMKEQKWANCADIEMEYLVKKGYITPQSRILDLGCGTGRHGKALQKYDTYYKGIDFIENRIKEAKDENLSNQTLSFELADAREYYEKKPYDTILSLYDVIGSFPIDRDNHKIISTAYRNLRRGGYFVLSVMNLGTTMQRCRQKFPKHIVYDIEKHVKSLLDLEPSTSMQDTGEIFNPRHLIIDQKTGIIYRKEQFTPIDQLPSELFIQDKRYTAQTITKSLLRHGFSIIDLKYVNAGQWEKTQKARSATSSKEILVIAQKPSIIGSFFNYCKSFLI